MTGRTRIASCLLLLGAFVVLESCTSVDMVVQHLLYTENHWLITQAMHNTGLALWFYQGPKACIAIFGVLCLSGVARRSPARPYFRYSYWSGTAETALAGEPSIRWRLMARYTTVPCSLS